jgi:putative lipoprotein
MNMNTWLKTVAVATTLALTTLSLTACQSSEKSEQQVSAQINTQVFYLDRSMLPPGAELTLTLEDVSLMDVAATKISTKTITLETAPPYNVALDYDASLIKPGMRYSVRANITKGDRLLYTSTSNNDPFAKPGKTLEIKLTKINKTIAVKPNAPLTNTYWKAITFFDNEVATPEGARELFLQMRNENQMRGFAGCNNFQGQFEQTESELTFSRVAATMMACEGRSMELENQMHQVINATTSFKIVGDSLTLYNQDKTRIGYFEAVYF